MILREFLKNFSGSLPPRACGRLDAGVCRNFDKPRSSPRAGPAPPTNFRQ
jgi:hypothetical protein